MHSWVVFVTLAALLSQVLTFGYLAAYSTDLSPQQRTRVILGWACLFWIMADGVLFLIRFGDMHQ